MSDLTGDFPPTVREAALIAADNALTAIWRHADANRAPDGSINVSTYAMAKAVIAAVEPILRADERAKVAEEITAVQPPDRAELPAWFDGYREGLRVAVALARQDPARMPGEAVERRTGSPTCPTTPEPAQATTAGFGTPDTNSTHDDRQEQ